MQTKEGKKIERLTELLDTIDDRLPKSDLLEFFGAKGWRHRIGWED